MPVGETNKSKSEIISEKDEIEIKSKKLGMPEKQRKKQSEKYIEK